MSTEKEKYLQQSKSNFIRYLYQEGQRNGVHKSPNFYSELIQFTKTPEGEKAFQKFIHINPKKFGFIDASITKHINRVFTS